MVKTHINKMYQDGEISEKNKDMLILPEKIKHRTKKCGKEFSENQSIWSANTWPMGIEGNPEVKDNTLDQVSIRELVPGTSPFSTRSLSIMATNYWLLHSDSSNYPKICPESCNGFQSPRVHFHWKFWLDHIRLIISVGVQAVNWYSKTSPCHEKLRRWKKL